MSKDASDDIVPQTDTPPLRFAMVEDHPPLYRGSYPLAKNLRFLERLRLKTILSITPEPLGEDIATWCSAQGVRMMHLTTNKEAKKARHPIAYYETKQALQIMINRVHQPIFVHCLNGSEVTSLVIACLRKLQCWSVSSTMAEFGRFCLVRPAHTSFIETFHADIEITKAVPRWLFRGVGTLGKEGIIAEHPTLKLKYSDPDMARQASELRKVAEGHALAMSGDKERQERLEHDGNELAQLETREVTHHRKHGNHTDEYRHAEGHG